MTTTENASAPKEKPLKEYMIEVPVPLSPAEKSSYSDQLAELVGQKGLLEKKKKQATQAIATEISRVSNEISRIASAVKAGEEIRMAEVFDIWNNGVIETRRKADNYVVRTRGATIEDRQESIPGLDDDEEDEDQGDDPVVLTPPGELPPQDDGDPEAEHDGETVTSSTGGQVHHMPDDPGVDDDVNPFEQEFEGDDEQAERAQQVSESHGDGTGTSATPVDKAERRRQISDSKKRGANSAAKSKPKKKK